MNVEAHLGDSLTARQTELLALLEAGLGNQQISDRLDITLTTVKGHLQRLYGKLGVSSRSVALARAKVLKLIWPAAAPDNRAGCMASACRHRGAAALPCLAAAPASPLLSRGSIESGVAQRPARRS